MKKLDQGTKLKGDVTGHREILTQLVRINSIYPNEAEIGRWFEDFLMNRGFRVSTQDIGSGRQNIFVEKGNGKPVIMFYGHQDTVPLVRPEEWKTDPFKATEYKGRIYGLGTSDMKGGIAAFLEAAQKTKIHLKLFFAVDEENISEGAWSAVKEKTDFFKDVDLIISGEPGFGVPFHHVVVGRTGRCIYTVKFNGKPGHIVNYKDSVDAIQHLGLFASSLYQRRENMFESDYSVAQVRKIVGESVGMSVCGSAEAEVEVLLGKEDSIDSVLKKLRNLADPRYTDIRLRDRKTPYLEGYWFDPKNIPYLQIIANVIKTHLGKNMETIVKSSVGDDNVLATLDVPVVTWGPSGVGHIPNEYVEVKALQILTYMYYDFLEKISELSPVKRSR